MSQTNRDRLEQWKRIPTPAEARKFLIALAGVAALVAQQALGLETFVPSELAPWLEVLVGSVTAAGVYFVPNREAPVIADGTGSHRADPSDPDLER